jgi:integrase
MTSRRHFSRSFSGKTLRDRRDEGGPAAIVRVLAETACVPAIVIDLQITDVDLMRGLLTDRGGEAPRSVRPEATRLFVGGHVQHL